jgi:hypothetical protein
VGSVSFLAVGLAAARRSTGFGPEPIAWLLLATLLAAALGAQLLPPPTRRDAARAARARR